MLSRWQQLKTGREEKGGGGNALAAMMTACGIEKLRGRLLAAFLDQEARRQCKALHWDRRQEAEGAIIKLGTLMCKGEGVDEGGRRGSKKAKEGTVFVGVGVVRRNELVSSRLAVRVLVLISIK
jgi:hypothetical protein